MPTYNDIISRATVPVPEPVSTQIIQDATAQSVVLNRAQRQPMSSKTLKQPVVSTLPEAYWVEGDTGLKQTTDMAFQMPIMTAEELASIAVVPDAVFDDTTVPLWDTLRPLIAESIGAKVDAAAIFGTDKPASWPTAIVPSAVAAGNTFTTQGDLGLSVAEMGEKISKDSGFDMNGIITPAGFRWRLRQIRDENGQFIYDMNAGTLFGLPADEVKNGAWASTTPESLVVGLDWSKAYVGIRQDITVKLLDQAVLTDAAGKVLINLAQQDAKAMRVVFRVGFQVYVPANRATGATKYPAGVIRAAA